MTTVGLTGGIGSGKSAVSRLLEKRGAFVIDADAVARELMAPGGAAYQGVVDRFGRGIQRSDQTIDRGRLAAVVFADPVARADLNELTHPLVRQVMLARLVAEPSDRLVVLDLPLLAEGGRDRWPLDGVIVVDTPVEVALERLVTLRGMDAASARARIAAQASRQERLSLADIVIDNSRDLVQLSAEVERAWAWISDLHQRYP
jgi:dephospho-CoA kinase